MNCGDRSSKLDWRGEDEASVTSNLKVPSERCENIRCDDELGT